MLVVDDDERNLLAIKNVIEDLAEVETAVSGDEALRHLLNGEFAVILLDVFMPGLDGYETAQIIRQRDQTKRIPIVFLSAVNKEKEHLMRGYAMGAVDYVFKPVEPVVLRSKVAVFVDLYAMNRGDPAQGRAGATPARRQFARQYRAAPGGKGAAPGRAAPGGDHPVAADHSLSGAPGDRARAARTSSAATWKRSPASPSSTSRTIRRSGPSACTRTIARRHWRRWPHDGRRDAFRSNIGGDAQTAATVTSTTRRCCSRTRKAGRWSSPGR